MEIVVNATELKMEEDCLEDLKHAIADILPGSETRVEYGLIQLGKCLGALNSALQTLDRELVKIPGVDEEIMTKCEYAVLNFHQIKRKKLSQGMKVNDHNDNNLSLNTSNNIDNDNKKFAYHKIRSKVISQTKSNCSSDFLQVPTNEDEISKKSSTEHDQGTEQKENILNPADSHPRCVESKVKDPISILNERYLLKLKGGDMLPKYIEEYLGTRNDNVPIWVSVLTVPEGFKVSATGSSKKRAKSSAAQMMLDKLDIFSLSKLSLPIITDHGHFFNIHQPTADPRWASYLQLLVGPIHHDLEYATVRNVFILYGHIKQLYVSPWSDERKQKLGYIVYSQSGVVKMLLARGYVMVGDIKVVVRKLEEQQSPLIELRHLQ